MYAYVFIMELLCTYWVYSADGSPWVAGLADPPAGRGLGSEHCNQTKYSFPAEKSLSQLSRIGQNKRLSSYWFIVKLYDSNWGKNWNLPEQTIGPLFVVVAFLGFVNFYTWRHVGEEVGLPPGQGCSKTSKQRNRKDRKI